MERKENTAWIVIRTPAGDTRVVEAVGYAIVDDVKDPGEAIRVGRERLIPVNTEGDEGDEGDEHSLIPLRHIQF